MTTISTFRARDEGLCPVEPDDQAQARVASDGGEPGEALTEEPGLQWPRGLAHSGLTPASSSAGSRNATAEAANTASVPVRASMIPPIAGPMKMPTLSIVVSEVRGGQFLRRARERGRSAAWVGRKSDCMRPTRAVST